MRWLRRLASEADYTAALPEDVQKLTEVEDIQSQWKESAGLFGVAQVSTNHPQLAKDRSKVFQLVK